MGGPGSGKSTLAQELSVSLEAPYYELDVIAYEGGSGRKIPLDVRLASLRAIIEQPLWITEGGFLWWTDSLLEAADVIVWLDLPFRITAWRVVKRHVQLNLAGTNRHPETVKLVHFLLRMWRRQTSRTALIPSAPDHDAATTRIAEAEILGAYANKVIRCTRTSEVARCRSQLLNTR